MIRGVLSIENSKTYYPDFKIANNIFKIIKELVLVFRGEEILPFFYKIKFICINVRQMLTNFGTEERSSQD
jgi:hypothetical protein